MVWESSRSSSRERKRWTKDRVRYTVIIFTQQSPFLKNMGKGDVKKTNKIARQVCKGDESQKGKKYWGGCG